VAKQSQLLTAMLAAIDLLAEPVQCVAKDVRLMLVMGENLAENLEQLLLEIDLHNVVVMQTIHPAKLLQQPILKRQAWQDLQAIQATYRKICL